MWIIGGVLSFYLLQKLAALLAIGLFLLDRLDEEKKKG